MNKAVIFDLDGVLTDTARFHFLAWQAIAERVGVSFTEEDNESLKGIDREKSLRWILQRSPNQYSDDEFQQLSDDKNRHYQQLIADMTPADSFAGVTELLEQLQQMGFKLGVASVSRNAAFVLQRLNLTHYFDYVADAAQITHTKPDPEIFLTVAKALRAAPEYCIGIEDAVAGVQAIKAAGMFAIGVGDPQLLSQADIVVAQTQMVSADRFPPDLTE